MKKNSVISVLLILVLVLTLCTGCAKENKYVNVGVEMSTAGLSLYLTNTAQKLESISTYVFFSDDIDETFEKISKDEQGIDISYISVDELSRIKPDSNFRVVFIDCFEESGELKGVWIARDGWLENAPNYSRRYIRGLVKSADYRASHMNLSYEDALASIEGMRDFDFSVQNDTLQFVAVFDQSNDDEIADVKFEVKSAKELRDMFEGFEAGSGEGYELCRAAYYKYCTATDAMSFEEMFSLDMMIEALDEVFNPEEN